MERLGETRQRLSHLPLLRFTSVVIIFVALDCLVCISLWIAGGDSLYMEDSVKEFSFTHSTFDLACIALVRCAILIGCFYYLEHFSLLKVSIGEHDKQRVGCRIVFFCHLGIFSATLVSLLYSIVKGSFILKSILQGTWNDIDQEHHMHITYKVLCIISIVFPAIEFIFSTISSWCIRRMIRVKRLRLLVNLNEDDNGKPRKKKADLKRIFLLAKPEYPLLFIGIVCLIISSGSLSIAPYLFGKIINYAVPGQTNCTEKYGKDIPPDSTCTSYTMARMNREVLYLVAVFVVGCIAITFRAIMFNLAGERFVARLRKQLFAAIIRQEMGFFDKSRIGELTNRLSADTQVIQSAVTENLSMLARYTMQMLISIGLMFYISAKLTAVLLSVVPIIAVSAVQFGRFLKDLRKKFQDELASASSTAEESFGNVVTVRAFSNEGKMITFYSKNIDESYGIGKKLAFLIGTFMGLVSLFMYGAAALVLWYGGYLVFHGKVEAGTLISLMLYTLNLAMCFAFLSNVYGEFMQAVGASIRIFELLDRESEITDGDQVLETLKGEILFDRVSFSYPSRSEEQVLNSVSFEVLPGQVVALVGQSGGGKSTIVKLIEHFYELSSGRILLSGHNIRQLDPSWFRRHIGLVNQEPVLFASSIADNISYGKDGATMSEIEEAAKQANAHDFIMSFDKGYNTMVGERGVRLSGGQKQRVAIARALLLNPDILLLDEATSALDAESEYLVQEAIDRAMEGRTVLVIAHRLSTVKNASKVIVIDQGKVVEQGTHMELLEHNGVYKQLVLRQLTHHNDL